MNEPIQAPISAGPSPHEPCPRSPPPKTFFRHLPSRPTTSGSDGSEARGYDSVSMISGLSSSANTGSIIARSEKPHRGFRPRRRGLRRASTSRTHRLLRAFRRPTYDLTSNAPVGQNRRVGKMVNGTLAQGWLYQDQLRPVAQLDGSGTNVVARFVYGSKPNVPDYMVIPSSANVYRILSDHLGSPRAVVDVSSGNLIETINFDEFGNETDTLAGTLPTGYVRIPFGFAGGLYDPDTGLVRFGARDYDATTGRWTAKDRSGFNGGQNNFYIYAANDPVNHIDADGHGWQTVVCLLTGGFICPDDPNPPQVHSPEGPPGPNTPNWPNGGPGGGGGGGGGGANFCPPPDPEPGCPPCVGPLPPDEYRYDSDQSRRHPPCPGAHIHAYLHIWRQDPETCECFTNTINSVICL